MILHIGQERLYAYNLFHAVEQWENYRDENNLGASESPGVTISENGKTIARVSYNGRLWANNGTEIKNNKEPMKTQTLQDVVAAFRAEYNAEAAKAKAEAAARAAEEDALQASALADVNQFADELVPLIGKKAWSIDRSHRREPVFSVFLPDREDPLLTVRVYRYPSSQSSSYEVREPYSRLNSKFTQDRSEALVLAAKIIGQQLAREDQAK